MGSKKKINGERGQRSFKNQLRGQHRLLKKLSSDASTGARSAIEEKIRLLESKLAQRQRLDREKRNATKYHKIKFFERIKLTRLERKLRRKLTQSPENTAYKQELEQISRDQLYVAHYPNHVKYIALFKGNKRVVDDEKTAEKRQKIRDEIDESLKERGVDVKPWVTANKDVAEKEDKKKRKKKKKEPESNNVDETSKLPKSSKEEQSSTVVVDPRFNVQTDDRFKLLESLDIQEDEDDAQSQGSASSSSSSHDVAQNKLTEAQDDSDDDSVENANQPNSLKRSPNEHDAQSSSSSSSDEDEDSESSSSASSNNVISNYNDKIQERTSDSDDDDDDDFFVKDSSSTANVFQDVKGPSMQNQKLGKNMGWATQKPGAFRKRQRRR